MVEEEREQAPERPDAVLAQNDYVTGARASNTTVEDPRQWLAVMHLFDAEGNYLSSEVHLGGSGLWNRIEACEKAYEYLEAMLAALERRGKLVYGDIWVKLFSIEIEGVLYGLFHDCNDYDPDFDPENPEEYWVMLEPGNIMFHPPYDTDMYST